MLSVGLPSAGLRAKPKLLFDAESPSLSAKRFLSRHPQRGPEHKTPLMHTGVNRGRERIDGAPHRLCGIYYLWDGAAVLYVGKATDVERALRWRKWSGIDFCGYFVDECAPEELHDRELAAIKEFRPPYNTTNAHYR
jgi:hypothetical protein